MKNTVDMNLLKGLSEAHGISGHEDDVLFVVKDHLQKTQSKIVASSDTMMNLFLRYPDAPSGPNIPRVMLDSHSDEVGFMVQSIEETGLIAFVPIGNWNPNTMPAQAVYVKNKSGQLITGFIATKPPHFLSEAERNAPVQVANLRIDVGASSAEEVRKHYEIDVGAPVAPKTDFHFNESTGLTRGKAFDNRVGSFCVVELMKRLQGRSLPVELVGAIAAQEEIGMRGAHITARRVKPNLAIIFEGSPADDNFTPAATAQCVLGKGVQIRYRDVGYLSHYRLAQKAAAIAESKGIPYQKAVRTGGSTNAASIHLKEFGIPALVLGIPVRYIHTHHGFLQQSDILHTLALAEAVIMQYEEVASVLTLPI